MVNKKFDLKITKILTDITDELKKHFHNLDESCFICVHDEKLKTYQLAIPHLFTFILPYNEEFKLKQPKIGFATYCNPSTVMTISQILNMFINIQLYDIMESYFIKDGVIYTGISAETHYLNHVLTNIGYFRCERCGKIYPIDDKTDIFCKKCNIIIKDRLN